MKVSHQNEFTSSSESVVSVFVRAALEDPIGVEDLLMAEGLEKSSCLNGMKVSHYLECYLIRKCGLCV